MRKKTPADSVEKGLTKRVKMLETAVSALFELLLQAGVITETSCRPRNIISPKRGTAPQKPVTKNPSRRNPPPSKTAKEDARSSVEFRIFTTRAPYDTGGRL
jgi:hypothetical protein